VSRLIADKFVEFLGQPIISVHKPGGGGSLAASFAAKAKPDGYTILFAGTSPILINPVLKKTDYKIEDFIPLGMGGDNPNRLSVKKDSRWKTLRDFVEEAKKSPAKLMVASYGKFSFSHLVLEQLSQVANIQVTHVSFKGAAEAMTNLLGGHVDAAMTSGVAGMIRRRFASRR